MFKRKEKEPKELWSPHFPVVLEKHGGQFGFTINDYGVGTTKGIFVDQITSAPVAHNCVSLTRGDKLESVNGVDIGRMSATSAMNQIQRAQGPAVFMVRQFGRNEVPWTQEMRARVNWANGRTHPSAPPMNPPPHQFGPPYRV